MPRHKRGWMSLPSGPLIAASPRLWTISSINRNNFLPFFWRGNFYTLWSTVLTSAVHPTAACHWVHISYPLYKVAKLGFVFCLPALFQVGYFPFCTQLAVKKKVLENSTRAFTLSPDSSSFSPWWNYVVANCVQIHFGIEGRRCSWSRNSI